MEANGHCLLIVNTEHGKSGTHTSRTDTFLCFQPVVGPCTLVAVWGFGNAVDGLLYLTGGLLSQFLPSRTTLHTTLCLADPGVAATEV